MELLDGTILRGMRGHQAKYRWMWPLAVAPKTHIRWLERKLVKIYKEERKDSRCNNRSKGGERMSSAGDLAFIYVVGSDTLDRELWDDVCEF